MIGKEAAGLYNKGLDFLTSDRYEEAISYYDRALDVIFPSSDKVTLEDDSQLEFVSAILNGKGSSLAHLGQYEDARKLFENALEFDSNNNNARDNLEVVMSELNKADYGFSGTESQSSSTDHDIASGSFSGGNMTDGTQSVDSDTAERFFDEGMGLYNQQKYVEAIEAFDKAVGEDRNLIGAWINMATAFHNLQRYDDALEAIDTALELDPNNSAALTNKVAVFMGLKRYQEAVQISNRAIASDPNEPLNYFNKGTSLLMLERYEEAVIEYDKALEIDPTDPDAWYNLASALFNIGRYQEALESINEAIRLDPQDLDAQDIKNAILDKLDEPSSSLSQVQGEEEKSPLEEQNQRGSDTNKPDRPEIPVF